MLISLDCGCGASVNLETDQEERAWLFVERFSNAHIECGFISPFARDGESKPIVVTRKRHPAIRILDDFMGDDDDDSGFV